MILETNHSDSIFICLSVKKLISNVKESANSWISATTVSITPKSDIPVFMGDSWGLVADLR